MDKPYFSLFGPAIRSYYYEDAYRSISENCDVPFEFVFVGNSSPLKRMPDNFRYIYSEASPAQCWEIAARESRADLLISTADDLRYSKNFLNRLMYYVSIIDLYKILISFRYIPDRCFELVPDETLQLRPGMIDSPTVPAGGIFRKDLWAELGGLDRRFYGSYADVDLILRIIYEKNMGIFVPPDCFLIEIPLGGKFKRLLKRSNTAELIDTFWFENGVFTKKRKLSFEPFIL